MGNVFAFCTGRAVVGEMEEVSATDISDISSIRMISSDGEGISGLVTPPARLFDAPTGKPTPERFKRPVNE